MAANRDCSGAAPSFVVLEALGSAYNITDDVAHSWNDIVRAVGEVLGKRPAIRGVPAEAIVGYIPELEGPLLGDKANSMRFDNAKIRSVIGPWKCEVSFRDGGHRPARSCTSGRTRATGRTQPSTPPSTKSSLTTTRRSQGRVRP